MVVMEIIQAHGLISGLLQNGEKNVVPLTTRYQVDATGLRADQRTAPLRCNMQLLGTTTKAEVISHGNSVTFLFQTHLGAVPYTAAGNGARAMVMDILRRLSGDMRFISSDIGVSVSPTGEVELRASHIVDGADLMAFFTALVAYAEAIRPFAEELRPLLQH
jgi:hypothetical protein